MDQTIKCKDCGADFLFTERDQKFFSEQGWTPPKRCKGCREEKKRRQAEGGTRARGS
jgi:DNA replicative helicase MCM subunit Mcm2 (Cdc46/Mcm family)